MRWIFSVVFLFVFFFFILESRREKSWANHSVGRALRVSRAPASPATTTRRQAHYLGLSAPGVDGQWRGCFLFPLLSVHKWNSPSLFRLCRGWCVQKPPHHSFFFFSFPAKHFSPLSQCTHPTLFIYFLFFSKLIFTVLATKLRRARVLKIKIVFSIFQTFSCTLDVWRPRNNWEQKI